MASMIRSDLDFVLQQILIAEAHAAGADLVSLLPNTFAAFGLRTVDGSYNNLMPGQTDFGAADQEFPRLVEAEYRDDLDGDNVGFPVPGGTDYGADGNIIDADPRIISNLIADMTSNNPAAVQAFVDAGFGSIVDGVLLDANGVPIPPGTLLTIPNVAPDEGLSAPFNSWFTFFGQFFDHGLDLVNKTGTETIYIPLQADDPLVLGDDGIAARPTTAGQPALHGGVANRRRRGRADQPDHALRRPEPDLHLARLAPGVPARVRARRHRPPVATGRLLEPLGGTARTATAAWRPGPTSRRRRATCSASSSPMATCSTCRCCGPTPTASSSRGTNGFATDHHRPRGRRHPEHR